MNAAIVLNIHEGNIVELCFDNPGQKVNTFSLDVLRQLEGHLKTISANPSLKALMITSAKSGNFIAGADLKQISNAENQKQIFEFIRYGQHVFQKLAELPFPSFACIDGACLGGGLELALACSYRLVSDSLKTQLGLPEVELGILPGWGGTQRLPRLIGLEQGMKFILSGRPVDGKKARRMGLADVIFAHEFFIPQALAFVQQKKGRCRTRKAPLNLRRLLLECNFLGRKLVFMATHKSVLKKTKGHYPAPLLILNIIKQSYHQTSIIKGLGLEVDGIASLLRGNTAKNLINIFFTSEKLKKDPGVLNVVSERKIKNTAVIGAGVMGGGIAWQFSYKGFPVRFKDVHWDAITRAYKEINGIYSQLVKIRKLQKDQVSTLMQRTSGTLNYQGMQNADLVVEAVVENLEIKKQVFRDLETYLKPQAILCSNTSSLRVDDMAKDLKHPERFIGMHFFNPVNRMPLVEVVPGKLTAPEVVVDTVAFLKKVGKTPVVVKDCSGFLVNRILLVGMLEALRMLEEGGDVLHIDSAMESFGMPMGPFRLADEVGLDVAYKVGAIFEREYGERMYVPPLLKELVELDCLGRKNDYGFFMYHKKQQILNPKLASVIKEYSTLKLDQDTIRNRVLFSMLNEAGRCLSEGIIDSPDYLDMAMILGTGFPPFQGGLIRWAQQIGMPKVIDKMSAYAEKFGKRFAPLENLKMLG